MEQRATKSATTPDDQSVVMRWECACRQPPILLATVDRLGRVNIKFRDRYWHVEGRVRTHCPRCGTEHVLEPGAMPGEG